MKFVFIFVALVFANLDFCQAQNKPSAHIESAERAVVTYQAYQRITDWDAHASNSHYTGGMRYYNGALIVPRGGRYYIYLQVFYRSSGTIFVYVNNKRVTMVQSPRPGRNEHGTMYAGGVFDLEENDEIKLSPGLRQLQNLHGELSHLLWGVFDLK